MFATSLLEPMLCMVVWLVLGVDGISGDCSTPLRLAFVVR